MHRSSKNVRKTNPIHGITKMTSHPWENRANNQKRGMKTHTGSYGCLRELTWRKNGEENMPTWKHRRMAYVFGFLLAQGVKMCFPKTDGNSNSNLGCHTLPIPCNNQLNQLLAVINDWVNKTRKVVDNLMGSPFDIWLLPIGPRVWISPPPLSLGNHAPSHYGCIDIAGCGYFN